MLNRREYLHPEWTIEELCQVKVHPMKTLFTGLFALVSLGAGIGLGAWGAMLETAHDGLPTKEYLESQAVETDTSHSPVLVVVGKRTWDFGSMERGMPNEHVFVIKNEGGAPLILAKGDTTCKCTSSSADGKEWRKGEKRSIAPGDKMEIKLDWTARTAEDTFSQSAEFSTNDLNMPSLRLLVSGKIMRTVRPDRDDWNVGGVSLNEEGSARMRLFAYKGQKLEIKKQEWVDADYSDHFSVTLEPLTAGELASEQGATAGLAVLLKIKAGLPLGPISQKLFLVTNMPGVPVVEIPVIGQVVGDVSISGPHVDSQLNKVSLGIVPLHAGKKLTIFVNVRGSAREQAQLKIASVEPAGVLLAELGAPKDENGKVTYPLTITVPKDAPVLNLLGSSEEQTGKIVIEATNTKVKQLPIRVKVAVQ